MRPILLQKDAAHLMNWIMPFFSKLGLLLFCVFLHVSNVRETREFSWGCPFFQPVTGLGSDPLKYTQNVISLPGG